MRTRNYLKNKLKIWLAVAIVLGAAILAITQLAYAERDGSVKAPKSNLHPTIDTPLGEGVLILTSMSGSEEISRLFRFQLEMISDDPAIDPKKIVGKKLTLTIDLPSAGERHFSGYVSRLVRVGTQPHSTKTIYQAEVIPWLWFLTRTADVRIFQNMSVPEILEQVFLEQVFNEIDIAEFVFRLGRVHPKKGYTVQYRETDFNFVSRLMEQEGIYYFFEHYKDKHTLVLGDSLIAYGLLAGEEEVSFEGPHEPSEVITDWSRASEFRSGEWAHTDYDFKKPSTDLFTSATSAVDLPGLGRYEIYDYPGGYAETSRGEQLAKIRIEAEDGLHDTVAGASNERRFFPGAKFTLVNHPDDDQNSQYLLTSVTHRLKRHANSVGKSRAVRMTYENQFTAIPSDVQFRPLQLTPKPLVNGIQTAIVVGPAGEEIHSDEFGRVKIKFHWDREGQCDENSSCWVRVAQSWSSQGHGEFFEPKIGQEVVVEFLDGDPDRPLITGFVYNADQLPPIDPSTR